VHHFKHFELNRNYVGFFMGIGTSLSFAYFYLSKNKIKRLIHLSIFVLFAFSAFATLSKGAWLSAFLFITLFLLYRLFVKFDHKMVGWAFLSMPIIIALIYSGIINLTTIVGAVDDRVNNSQETIGERSEYIQDAIEIISHHPLLGVGSGGYRDAANFYRLNDTSDPHNAFLWFFSELGVGGFLIMLILTVYVCIYSNHYKYSYNRAAFYNEIFLDCYWFSFFNKYFTY
jgi:O-antigen ligase